MNLNEVERRICKVEGWLSKDEGRLLYKLATECTGRGVIVEIGSWKGKSTLWLAHGSRAGRSVKIHAVDPHTGSREHHAQLGKVWTFDEFCHNIKTAGMDDLVVPHVAFSAECARTFDEPVELIFVDGLHEWDGVKADFDAWFPKLIDGGVMAFHDTTGWDDVRKLVTEFVFKSRFFKKVGFTNSITYAERTTQNSLFDRMRNRWMLCLFLAHACIDRQIWRLGHNYVLPAWNWFLRRRSPSAAPTPTPVPVPIPISSSRELGTNQTATRK
jgi:predicted O-methyltransferase YrrM